MESKNTSIPLLATFNIPISSDLSFFGAVRNSLNIWYPEGMLPRRTYSLMITYIIHNQLQNKPPSIQMSSVPKVDLVKAVLLRSSKQAIVFVANNDAIVSFLTRGNEIPLSGPLAASFKNVESMLTESIALHADEVQHARVFQAVDQICRESACEYTAAFMRRDQILLVMSTANPISQLGQPFVQRKGGLMAFSDNLGTIDSIRRVNRVMIEDHVCQVRAYWFNTSMS